LADRKGQLLADCCPIGSLKSGHSNGKFWQELPISTSGQNGSILLAEPNNWNDQLPYQ
jgi:hypothetical protein